MTYSGAHDPLIACLSHLTGLFGRSRSPAALSAGLAAPHAGLSVPFFLEAAQNAALHAAQHDVPDHFTQSLLPCIAFSDEAAVCVLTLDGQGNAHIWNPHTTQEESLPLATLRARYGAGILTVRPSSGFIDPALRAILHEKSHWFWEQVRRHTPVYRKVLLASFLINLFALASPIYTMNVYDRVIPYAAIETGWALGLGVLFIFMFDFTIRSLRGIFIDFAARHIDVQVARMLFDQVLDMKLAARPSSSGAFANMLREFETVRDFFTSATLVTLIDLPFALLFLGVIFYLGGAIGLWIIALMGLSLAASLLIQIPLKKHIRASLKSAETKHGLLVEALFGLETIKTMVADGRIRARYTAHVAENAKAAQQSRYYSALGVNTATFIQQISSVIILLAGMYMVRDSDMSTGSLIACVMLASRALSPVTQVANLMSRYHQSMGSLATLTKIMTSPREREEGRDFLHRPDLQGQITFQDVTFSYPATSRPVLQNINFSIQQGERVGIIGRIGSGKSTLAKLMLKLYEPSAGRILIDGSDYTQIDPADLRHTFAYISQDVLLFAGSIRDNITLACPSATEAEIVAAAKAAGAHDFIAAHPMGYDAPVMERGDGLSGGQKQCIALARALLLNPPVFICDEPTNAMDMQAEENFARLISLEAQNRTLILVTHRANLLPLTTRLIVIDGGRVAMDGPRDDILARISGRPAHRTRTQEDE